MLRHLRKTVNQLVCHKKRGKAQKILITTHNKIMMDVILFNLGKEEGGCGCSTLAGHQMLTQMFSHSPFLTVWGKKIRCKNSWVKIRTGKSLTYYHHGQNRLNLEKINFIFCQLKIAQISKKQIKTRDFL